jgi:hypothetical protein
VFTGGGLSSHCGNDVDDVDFLAPFRGGMMSFAAVFLFLTSLLAFVVTAGTGGKAGTGRD